MAVEPQDLATGRLSGGKEAAVGAIALILLAVSGPFPSNSALTILSIFCIFTAINWCGH
ncbi:MAG: hypothetical protein IPL38_03605 [Rhodobacter sp.]|nr:hypothetical protein [Rhodobacter sp.]